MISNTELMTMLAKVQASIDELTSDGTTTESIKMMNLYQQLHMVKQAIQQIQIIKGAF